MLSAVHRVNASGVVGAVSRHVASQPEVLILCDITQPGNPAKGRGFFQLRGTALGPKLDLFEPMHGIDILKPYDVKSFISCATFCAATGLTFFAEGHAIFSLDERNVVRKVLAVAGNEPGYEHGKGLEFSYPSELAAPDSHTLYVSDAFGLHRVDFALSEEHGVVATYVTMLREHDGDSLGQLSLACAPGCFLLASATAMYRQQQDPSQGTHEYSTARWSPWVGQEGSRGGADGFGCDARFSSIAAVGVTADGGAIIVDALQDGTSTIRSVTSDGIVKTIYRPTTTESSDIGNCSPCNDDNTSICNADTRSPISHYEACSTSSNHHCHENERTDSAFHSGGLRCPIVLPDGTLLLCAPLQGTLVLLRTSELTETQGPCSTGQHLAAALATASDPVQPAFKDCDDPYDDYMMDESMECVSPAYSSCCSSNRLEYSNMVANTPGDMDEEMLQATCSSCSVTPLAGTPAGSSGAGYGGDSCFDDGYWEGDEVSSSAAPKHWECARQGQGMVRDRLMLLVGAAEVLEGR